MPLFLVCLFVCFGGASKHYYLPWGTIKKYFISSDRLLCIQAGLELALVPLFLLSKCISGTLDMQPVYAVLGFKPRVSCMLGKLHSPVSTDMFYRVFVHCEGLLSA